MPLPRRALALWFLTLFLAPPLAHGHEGEGGRVTTSQQAYTHLGLVLGDESVCFRFENTQKTAVAIEVAVLVMDEADARTARLEKHYEPSGVVVEPGEAFTDCFDPPSWTLVPPGTYLVAIHDGAHALAVSEPFDIVASAPVRCAYEILFDQWNPTGAAARCGNHVLA